MTDAKKKTPRCDSCNARLLQKGVLRVAHPIRFENGQCTAKCHFCKKTTSVPLELSGEPALVLDRRTQT